MVLPAKYYSVGVDRLKILDGKRLLSFMNELVKICCNDPFVPKPSLTSFSCYSGMDAMTKRLVWTQIQKKMDRGNVSLILTSHSMEECEVLCSRLAVMAKGQFTCLGTLPHIKAKYHTKIVFHFFRI